MHFIISQKYIIERLLVGLVKASKGSAAWSFCTHGLWQIHSLPSFTGSSMRANMKPNSMFVKAGSASLPLPASTAALIAFSVPDTEANAPQVVEAVPSYTSVLVHYRPELASYAEVKAFLSSLYDHAAAAADSRTVTCLVDDGPEVFGQRCDTILSFDALDAVVTEERERGIHRFLIAGDEPLQHKRELVAVANKHSRCTFWVLTGGKLIDERFARDLLRTGNVIPLLTREKLDGTPAQASEILHTFRVLFGMLVSGSEPAADQDRAIEQGAKEVLLITDPYALGYGTPPQDRTIGQSMGDTPDLTLPVRLWRLKRENGRDARWMLDDARHLVIDSLGIAGIVNDSGEDSGFAHILRLREVAPA